MVHPASNAQTPTGTMGELPAGFSLTAVPALPRPPKGDPSTAKLSTDLRKSILPSGYALSGEVPSKRHRKGTGSPGTEWKHVPRSREGGNMGGGGNGLLVYLSAQPSEKHCPSNTVQAGEAEDSQGQVQRQPQASSTLIGDWLLGQEGRSCWSQLTR